MLVDTHKLLGSMYFERFMYVVIFVACTIKPVSILKIWLMSICSEGKTCNTLGRAKFSQDRIDKTVKLVADFYTVEFILHRRKMQQMILPGSNGLLV